MQPCHSRGGRSHCDPHFAGSHPYTRRSQRCAGLAPIGPCRRRGQTGAVRPPGPGWPREGPRVRGQGALRQQREGPLEGAAARAAGSGWRGVARAGRRRRHKRRGARSRVLSGRRCGWRPGWRPARPRCPGAGDGGRPRPTAPLHPGLAWRAGGRRRLLPWPPGGTHPRAGTWRNGVRSGKGPVSPVGSLRRSGSRAG